MAKPNQSLPGAKRQGFRQFFLSLGIALFLLLGFFYLQRGDLPLVIPVIVGGVATLSLLVGLTWPPPAPLSEQEKAARALNEEEDIIRSGPDALAYAEKIFNPGGNCGLQRLQ